MLRSLVGSEMCIRDRDKSTHLTATLATTTSTIASPTILQLAGADLGKGTIEIGEELLWVDSFDRIANTATVSPYGRGYLGTTPSTAAAGTRVIISPTFPRYVVKRAINDTIRALGSSIFAVKQTTFTYNAAAVAEPATVSTYAFVAACRSTVGAPDKVRAPVIVLPALSTNES